MKRLFETWHQGEGPGSRSYASSTGPQQTFLSGISRPQPSDCLIPGLPSSTKEYTRTAFRYPRVYPDCLQVPRSIYRDCLQVPRSIPTCMLDIWDRKYPIAGSSWVLGLGRPSQIRGSPSCMGKGRLPTNEMRGSPSCMCKKQGSLAHEGTLRARVTFPHGSGSGAAVSYVSGPSEASLTCHCLCLS
jgi:hypothetical protein